jgi:hypothetical protein
MKWLVVALSVLLPCLLPHPAHAAGGISHIYLARRAVAQTGDPALRRLLEAHASAYAVGANYPDTGYLKGAQYGEDSHWDPFVYAYADYLKERYADPGAEAPRQVAFLMGVATHRVSDEVFHWVFLDAVAEHDFGGDWDAAHRWGDFGLDLVVTVDKRQWLDHPTRWYVPVSDLVEVYRRMGLRISRQQIIAANAAYFFAGVGERLMAPWTYRSYKKRAPWAVAHYDDATQGGYRAMQPQIAAYLDDLWRYLGAPLAARPAIPRYSRHVHHPAEHLSAALSATAMSEGAASVPVQETPDGAVELGAPVIHNSSLYRYLLNTYLWAAGSDDR